MGHTQTGTRKKLDQVTISWRKKTINNSNNNKRTDMHFERQWLLISRQTLFVIKSILPNRRFPGKSTVRDAYPEGILYPQLYAKV
jgi:hypothetical protein